MKLYLDNCCFNRPFDDQSQLRIRLETEAKLRIQEDVRGGTYELVWSYILDYENRKNPFPERREQIGKWRDYSVADIEEDEGVLRIAAAVNNKGIKKIDSLHIGCAVKAGADCFLTTDDAVLKIASLIEDIRITDPIGFIKEVSK